MLQNNQEYITTSFQKLNDALKTLNNEIIVLDFSHFSPHNNTHQNHYDIYLKSLASSEAYKEKYLNYIKYLITNQENGWKKFENGRQRILYNFDNSNTEIENSGNSLVCINDEKELINVNVANDFDAKQHLIEDFLNVSNLPGKCFVIYAEEHGDAQSIVYVLLKEKIKINDNEVESINLLEEVPDNLKDFDKELQTLLIHEMVNSLVEEKTSLYQEVQDLKTQTMFSLTTHSLKTHLNTTVIKEKNAFYDKLENCPDLKKDFKQYLDREVESLFRLTEILSLVDKINDTPKFIEVAKRLELLSESKLNYNLEDHLAHFNRRINLEVSEPPINICYSTNLSDFQFPIVIYNLYLGKDLLKLFFNTIFENIVAYGKVEKLKRTLFIKNEENKIVFSNKTNDRTIQLDETKLTGNYRLFKKLLEDTNSGKLSIPSVTDYEFKIIISYGK